MDTLMGLVEAASSWAEPGLEHAMLATLPAALLLLAVLTINVTLRRWLTAGQKCLLWGLVLIRLLLPTAPASLLSLANLAQWAQAAMTHADPAGDDTDRAGDDGGWLSLAHYEPEPLATDVRSWMKRPHPQPAAPQTERWLELVATFLPPVWLFAAVVQIVWTLIGHGRLCRRIGRIPACDDPRLVELWAQCRAVARVRRPIPIVLFDELGQPALLGLPRPRLLLPTESADLSDEQLRMVMLHELAHVRRWDVAANWLLVLLRAIDWWNPVYWLAAARYRSLREQACDAWVLRRLGKDSSQGYGELLLRFAQRQPTGSLWRVTLPASILGLLPAMFRRFALRGRIRALRHAANRQGRWQTIPAGALLLLIAISGLTDATAWQPPADEQLDWLPPAAHRSEFPATAPAPELGPPVTYSYSIDKCVAQITTDPQVEKLARETIAFEIAHLLKYNEAVWNLHEWVPRLADQDTDATQASADTFSLDGDTLIVTAPRELQDEIARRLAAWEQSGMPQIAIEMRFMTDRRDLASRLGIAWRYVDTHGTDQVADLEPDATGPAVRTQMTTDDYLPMVVATLDERQARAALGAGADGRAIGLVPSA